MQIFEGILRQYAQLSARNSRYKSSIQNFDFSQIQPQSRTSVTNMSTDPDATTFSGAENMTMPSVSRYGGESAGEGFSDIKEVYEKMEFDAMRYNRNFDTQTGAEKI